MRAIKLSLLLGGLFNISMGAIFFQTSRLEWFFHATSILEKNFFGREVNLILPTDPMHLLLIHGFGAGVIILGATLLYSSVHPRRFLPFILFDALGRMMYGATMVYSVFQYDLARMVFVFGVVELIFAILYLYSSWYLTRVQLKHA